MSAETQAAEAAQDSEAALASALQTRLATELGSSATVEDLAGTSMGASKETYTFTLVTEDRARKMILRRERQDGSTDPTMPLEVEALRLAQDAGVTVPTIVSAAADDAELGGYIVMEHCAGESIPPKILRDERYADARVGLAHSLGQELARIHSAVIGKVRELAVQDELAELEDLYRTHGPETPAFAAAFAWLRVNRPDPRSKTLVHGDLRMGNVLVDESGLTAVLDWELAHIGDPLMDFGWLCAKVWRFGSPLEAGGVGTREQLVAGYAEAGGDPPTDTELDWWEVFSILRWGVMCKMQATRHLSGDNLSLELAMIGRRVAECEHDALLLLDLTTHHQIADPLEVSTASPGIFSDPSADQLLEELARTEVPGYVGRLRTGALNVARREIRVGARLQADYAAALADAGFASEPALTRALAAGEADIHTPSIHRAVVTGVDARLAVWNPRYTAQP